MKEERTTVKSQIKKAFLALLSEKAYMDITISDLVKRAQVARMSFYRNFDSLDDIVNCIADDIIQDFVTSVLPVIQENSERKWREYLFALFYRFIQSQKEFGISFSRFESDHKNNIIMRRVQEKMSQVKIDLPDITLEKKYISIGKISLIDGIARKWASTGMQETPEEVIDLIMSVIMKF